MYWFSPPPKQTGGRAEQDEDQGKAQHKHQRVQKYRPAAHAVAAIAWSFDAGGAGACRTRLPLHQFSHMNLSSACTLRVAL